MKYLNTVEYITTVCKFTYAIIYKPPDELMFMCTIAVIVAAAVMAWNGVNVSYQSALT